MGGVRDPITGGYEDPDPATLRPDLGSVAARAACPIPAPSGAVRDYSRADRYMGISSSKEPPVRTELYACCGG